MSTVPPGVFILRSTTTSPFGRKVRMAIEVLGLSRRIVRKDADTLDANDSLRVVWQSTRFVRYGSGESVAPADGSGRTASLVFMRRVGPGRSFAMGLSRQSARPAPGAAGQWEREAFAKLSFELGS